MSTTSVKDAIESRRAGQHARTKTRRAAWRALLAVGLVLAVGTLLALALGPHSRLFMVFAILAIAFFVGVDRRALPFIDRWDRGARGEEEVGAVLESIDGRGWFSIHDASVGRGNIDHIAIGPAGVFTIETKHRRGSIHLERIDSRHLRQAYAEAKAIERILELRVEPLLVYSNAYLVGKVPCLREGVRILPARMLAGYLERRGGTIPSERVAAVHSQLVEELGRRGHR